MGKENNQSVFSTNKKYINKKKKIERLSNNRKKVYYDNEFIGFHLNLVRAGYEKGFYKFYSFNEKSTRKECNIEIRAKLKQMTKKFNEDSQLPQNSEFKKITDYMWKIF